MGEYCDEQACTEESCGDHGDCNEKTGQCECDKGWMGPHCDRETCTDESCGDHGKCDKDSGRCICDDGWGGEHCDQKLKEEAPADDFGPTTEDWDEPERPQKVARQVKPDSGGSTGIPFFPWGF